MKKRHKILFPFELPGGTGGAVQRTNSEQNRHPDSQPKMHHSSTKRKTSHTKQEHTLQITCESF